MKKLINKDKEESNTEDLSGTQKIYNNPRTYFQQKINNILPKEKDSSILFENIFKLQQVYTFEKSKISGKIDTDSWKVMMELFFKLGPVKFAEIVSILKGKTITFPSEEEYRDSIITSLCYYYKEVENLDWEQIKDKLSVDKLNTIKYGIRVQQLKGFISEQTFKDLKGVMKNETCE